ncbi:uncharacterized protein LOC109511997 [Hippocampus comes]|uniref:uncharacterized protein LOC109511997 n=1 Tax=Hippocampus comes TaxID=109280 RepID=UPI00094F0665|nr:PREDICTED: uncharacterized protein LOC109511997 [Hippocampus comes]
MFGASLFLHPGAVVLLPPAADPSLNVMVAIVCAVLILTHLLVGLIAHKLDHLDGLRLSQVPLCGRGGLYHYRVLVKTGWRHGAGTTAHVGISLYGVNKSGSRHLQRVGAFQRGSLDQFHLETDVSLGEVWKIRIWHDNTGLDPSWYVQHVVVWDPVTDHMFFFLVDDWLSVENPKNGTVEKEILASCPEELSQFRRILSSQLIFGMVEHHLWLSLWERPIHSVFTRAQRVTCSALMLHLYLASGALWYGAVGTQGHNGPVSAKLLFSMETVAVGMVVAVLLFPLQCLICFLFRKCHSQVIVDTSVPSPVCYSVEMDVYLGQTELSGPSFLSLSGPSSRLQDSPSSLLESKGFDSSILDFWAASGLVPQTDDICQEATATSWASCDSLLKESEDLELCDASLALCATRQLRRKKARMQLHLTPRASSDPPAAFLHPLQKDIVDYHSPAQEQDTAKPLLAHNHNMKNFLTLSEENLLMSIEEATEDTLHFTKNNSDSGRDSPTTTSTFSNTQSTSCSSWWDHADDKYHRELEYLTFEPHSGPSQCEAKLNRCPSVLSVDSVAGTFLPSPSPDSTRCSSTTRIGTETWTLSLSLTSFEVQGGPVAVSLCVFSSLCQYYSIKERTWSSEGLKPLEGTTLQTVHCLTHHLTMFGASLFLHPGAVVLLPPAADPSLNVMVAIVCAVLILTHLLVGLIAHKLDHLDGLRLSQVPLCGRGGLYHYRVLVKTGWRHGAGTTAHVGISLYGVNKSGSRHLQRVGAFQRGSLDQFHLETDVSLGEVWKIRIWHDNTGLDPSWYVQHVVVWDPVTDHMFFFLVDDWLSVENPKNGTVEKEILASCPEELSQFRRILSSQLIFGMVEHHLWLSLWERPIHSVFTRAQRVTCSALMLHLYLASGALWYGAVGTQGHNGPVSAKLLFSMETVAVGMVVAVLLFPLQCLICFLFRKCHSQVIVDTSVPSSPVCYSVEMDVYLGQTELSGPSFLSLSGPSSRLQDSPSSLLESKGFDSSILDFWAASGLVPQTDDICQEATATSWASCDSLLKESEDLELCDASLALCATRQLRRKKARMQLHLTPRASSDPPAAFLHPLQKDIVDYHSPAQEQDTAKPLLAHNHNMKNFLTLSEENLLMSIEEATEDTLHFTKNNSDSGRDSPTTTSTFSNTQSTSCSSWWDHADDKYHRELEYLTFEPHSGPSQCEAKLNRCPSVLSVDSVAGTFLPSPSPDSTRCSSTTRIGTETWVIVDTSVPSPVCYSVEMDVYLGQTELSGPSFLSLSGPSSRLQDSPSSLLESKGFDSSILDFWAASGLVPQTDDICQEATATSWASCDSLLKESEDLELCDASLALCATRQLRRKKARMQLHLTPRASSDPPAAFLHPLQKDIVDYHSPAQEQDTAKPLLAHNHNMKNFLTLSEENLLMSIEEATEDTLHFTKNNSDSGRDSPTTTSTFSNTQSTSCSSWWDHADDKYHRELEYLTFEPHSGPSQCEAKLNRCPSVLSVDSVASTFLPSPSPDSTRCSSTTRIGTETWVGKCKNE